MFSHMVWFISHLNGFNICFGAPYDMVYICWIYDMVFNTKGASVLARSRARPLTTLFFSKTISNHILTILTHSNHIPPILTKLQLFISLSPGGRFS
jgi:hypothetical protein